MSQLTTDCDSKNANLDISATLSKEKQCVDEYPTEKLPLEIVQDARLITARGNVITRDGIVVSIEESDTSLATNVFSDSEVAAHYRKVYDEATLRGHDATVKLSGVPL